MKNWFAIFHQTATSWKKYTEHYRSIHCGPKNCHPFSFHYNFHKCWLISIIFGTRYTALICNIIIIDLPTSHTYWCCIALEKKSVAKIITLPNKLHFLLIEISCAIHQQHRPQCFAISPSVNQALCQIGHFPNWYLIHAILHHARPIW